MSPHHTFDFPLPQDGQSLFFIGIHFLLHVLSLDKTQHLPQFDNIHLIILFYPRSPETSALAPNHNGLVSRAF